ncbi:Zinc finger CCCH domain-containing protein 5 [Ananas comosus]|uniref:Zinc finger CCCH domain-containing protein 5 n=1 Tax=Ananas comosus TaxID=4615 RepID=A0A199V2J9_ANACO|nr:Zinc finger CCCH domain-containing protein 5 [Ananas comosus]
MVEYPERPGQPECTYYMKNGTCKFGSTCKFHHPKQGGHVQQVLLNYFGYPLRPGEKECSYYMKTGQCKFGLTCKFHHPEPSSVPSSQQYPPLATMQLGTSVMPRPYVSGSYGPMMVSPGVLPMPYPDAQPCTYYMRHGECKFGPACRFDHPMGSMSYSPSASSLSDMPVAPYPIGYAVATLAPSSSSSDLRLEYFTTKDSASSRMASVESASGSIGSIFSRGGYAPHAFIHPQTSLVAVSASSTSHGSEISG